MWPGHLKQSKIHSFLEILSVCILDSFEALVGNFILSFFLFFWQFYFEFFVTKKTVVSVAETFYFQSYERVSQLAVNLPLGSNDRLAFIPHFYNKGSQHICRSYDRARKEIERAQSSVQRQEEEKRPRKEQINDKQRHERGQMEICLYYFWQFRRRRIWAVVHRSVNALARTSLSWSETSSTEIQ